MLLSREQSVKSAHLLPPLLLPFWLITAQGRLHKCVTHMRQGYAPIWSPGMPRGCWSQALKGGCTQSQLWILEQREKWAHLCSMVFFGQVFIGLNGFHWLPNIGPTMGWYYAISEVYMGIPKLEAEVDPQTGSWEQTVERSIPKQGTVERQHLLTSRLCASPPRMGKKSDV